MVNKKEILLINIGVFLEYFDMYLYVHMAFLLNGVFFPKTDPYTASLLAAFTFSATYMLRPVGALFFGYLGDIVGRKSTIIITTFMMALCSFTIASLPSYNKIGVTSSVIMVVCRLLQGFSSVGELVGAMIYFTESSKPPRSYFYTAIVSLAAALGGTFALSVGALFLLMNQEEGWRIAFYFGASVALVGSVARSQLRETPEFLQGRQRKKQKISINFLQLLPCKKTRKSFLCYTGVEWLRPICFYLAFIHLGEVLKNKIGLSNTELVLQNLYVAIVDSIGYFFYAWASLRFLPMAILKIRGALFLLFALMFPFIFNQSNSAMDIFLIQSCVVLLGEGATPAGALFLRAFPLIGRYTQASLSYAISRVVAALLASYGCVMFSEYYGAEGIGLFLFFVGAASYYSAFYFDQSIKKINLK